MPMTFPFRVAMIGECMIELKELAAGALTRGFGGDTFNTAAYMARLGARLGPFVDYVSAVGDDRFSAEMVAYWNANGVGSRLTAALPGRRPGLYFITVDASGERRFTYWRGEAAVRDCFEAEGAEAALAALGGFDLVYLSGISLAVLRPVSRAAPSRAARRDRGGRRRGRLRLQSSPRAVVERKGGARRLGARIRLRPHCADDGRGARGHRG